MLLISIGLLLGYGMEVALLLVFFGMIQVNAGGYHAKTHKRCLSIMALGALLFLFLLPIYQSSLLLQASSVFIGTISVVVMAPVAHKNHPLSPKKSRQLGKRAKVIAVGFALLWCIISFNDVGAFMQGIIPIVMLYTFISLICAWLKAGR
ncbi:MAG: accessory gene regulator B family protein [Firmicutes bacterium]|nr:accessory gene regulator B family protein [Bacillota bacterium]